MGIVILFLRRGNIHRFPTVREEARNVRYGATAPLHGFGLPGAATTPVCQYVGEGVVQLALLATTNSVTKRCSVP